MDAKSIEALSGLVDGGINKIISVLALFALVYFAKNVIDLWKQRKEKEANNADQMPRLADAVGGLANAFTQQAEGYTEMANAIRDGFAAMPQALADANAPLMAKMEDYREHDQALYRLFLNHTKHNADEIGELKKFLEEKGFPYAPKIP